MQSRLNRYVVDRLGMMGAISHDLRTPLTRIRFKMESVKEPARSAVLGDVQHMENMIDLVLGFIRGLDHAAPRERLDLNSLVSVAVEEAALPGHRIEFIEPDTADLAIVEVDVVAMRNVLDNLLQNAIKYADRAEVEIVRGERDVTVRIVDFGPGLPETELEKVFLPFYRVEHPGKDAPGVGLGLAIARSVARAHGGDVVLSNTPRGLLAALVLPLKTNG
jgi:signal transduction histidine kinase